ncbi:MAG: hypothetical protein SF051_13480, partial [Elusimicrobiota bacterium]|nr:hypothetical protein [Elusimicrobiota bacterium]
MLTAALLWAAATASAHMNYPIRPVRAVLRAEPGRTVVDLRTDSIIWIAEVLGAEDLPAPWPPEARERVESYVNAHLVLKAGDALLRGKLVQARHAQKPWESHEQGELRLRLVYPEVPAGSVLSGEARFFEEHRRELAEEGVARTADQVYRTELEVPGRAARRFTLVPEAPGFSLPAEEARRGPAAMAMEGLGAGAACALAAASAWPAVLALVLA